MCAIPSWKVWGQTPESTPKVPLTQAQLKAAQARSAQALALLNEQGVEPNQTQTPPGAVKTKTSKRMSDAEDVLMAVRTPPPPENARPALAISERVLNADPQATISTDGHVVYAFGRGVFPLVCAVFQVTEIDLEKGEVAGQDDIDVGDKRLSVTVRTAGDMRYLVVRPTARDIDTTMTVGTNRGRVYYFRAVSGERPITRIAFSYPEEEAERREAEARAARERAAEMERLKVLAVPAKLIPWKYTTKLHGSAAHLMNPINIGDDGARTRIQLSAQVLELGLPTLQIQGPAGPIPANIHWEDRTTLVVDAVFERGCLLYGVGKKQQRACITREGAVEHYGQR